MQCLPLVQGLRVTTRFAPPYLSLHEPDSRSSCPLNILPGGRDRLVLPLAQRVPILLALAKLADGTTFSKL